MAKTLRDAFGQTGDYSPELAAMFGDTYLDHPDDPALEDGLGLRQRGFKAYRINDLLDRAIASAPDISCRQNQRLLVDHLRAVRTQSRRGRLLDWEDNWSVNKHLETCHQPLCHRLNNRA